MLKTKYETFDTKVKINKIIFIKSNEEKISTFFFLKSC